MCYCLQASISLHVLKAEKEQKLAVKETTNSKSRDGLSQVVFLVILSSHLSELTRENKALWRKYCSFKLIILPYRYNQPEDRSIKSYIIEFIQILNNVNCYLKYILH